MWNAQRSLKTQQWEKKINNPVGTQATDMNRYFAEEATQMAHKHMRRCSSSLAIKEMPSKTTVKYHNIPSRMSVRKHRGKSKDAEKLDHAHIAGRNVKWYSHSGKKYGSFFLKNKQTKILNVYLP